MSNTKTKPKEPATKRDPRTLEVQQKDKAQTREAMMAEIAYDPAARSLSGARGFIKGTMGDQPLTESLDALMVQIREVRSGNMQSAEKTLVAQANTLDAIFNELARRAALNMGEYINATDTYLRLALKAQSQCWATLETLATIKNPPVIYAKQANISNGPQQVNNGMVAPAPAHGENEIEQSKQSRESHELLTDTRASQAASRVNQTLEAVGAIHRA